MNERNTTAAAVLGVSLAVGLALAGWFVGNALLRARAAERFVTVRGFSEQEVAADLVIWPLSFVVTGNDLATLQQRYEGAAARIAEFLRKEFPENECSVSAPRVTDREAQGGFSQGNRPVDRYVAEGAVTVRTGKIDIAKAAMRRSSELVREGVPLVRSYEQNTEYLFTQLDKVKPAMIAEATKDARRAAQQFADDSGARVGAIRRAQQGLFTVDNRDPFSPEFKKIRVVTTVEYFLDSD